MVSSKRLPIATFVVLITTASAVFAEPRNEEEEKPAAPQSDKRRQFLSPYAGQAQAMRPVVYGAPQLPAAPPPVYAPAGLQPVAPVVAAVGQCPGGPSLPIECDPKRPWPQCPPQSYCYATNSVDIGPYFCCPIWSTYGAAWRPATPFYNYVPPIPANWPDVMKMTANWPAAAVGLPIAAAPAPMAIQAPIMAMGPYASKSKKQQEFEIDPAANQKQIDASINEWMTRQTALLEDAEKAGSVISP